MKRPSVLWMDHTQPWFCYSCVVVPSFFVSMQRNLRPPLCRACQAAPAVTRRGALRTLAAGLLLDLPARAEPVAGGEESWVLQAAPGWRRDDLPAVLGEPSSTVGCGCLPFCLLLFDAAQSTAASSSTRIRASASAEPAQATPSRTSRGGPLTGRSPGSRPPAHIPAGGRY